MSKRKLSERVLNDEVREIVELATITEHTRRETEQRDVQHLGMIRDRFVLRGQEDFGKFNAKRLDFSLRQWDNSIDLRTGLREDPASTYQFLEHFFAALFQRCEELGGQPQDIVHLYLNTGEGNIAFNADYAGRDHMTLGGLTSPHTSTMERMLENFAAVIQSDKAVVLDHNTSLRVFLFRPPN